MMTKIMMVMMKQVTVSRVVISPLKYPTDYKLFIDGAAGAMGQI